MGFSEDAGQYFFLCFIHHLLQLGFLGIDPGTAAFAFSFSSLPSFLEFIDVIFSNQPKSRPYSFMDTQPFAYPSCPIQTHALEPLSRLCLDRNCKAKSPVCCICEFQSHSGHATVPIKHILKQIATSAQLLSPVEGAGKLAALRKQFFQAISKCRRQIIDELAQLETKGDLYFNNCEQTLLSFYSLGQCLPPEAQTDPKFYKKYFSKLLTLIPEDDKNAFVLEEKVNSLLDGFRGVQKRLLDQLSSIEISFKKSVHTTYSIFEGGRNYDARWSETLKGTKIKLANMIAEQSGMESSGQRFALMQDPLPESMKTQWGIKVKKFVGWVGVGICLQKKITAANYHFNYTNIGHGSYLISTNGYTWSHSVKEFNSAFKCFQFTINDVVYIEYDPQNLKLRFRKNQGGEKYQLDIVPPLSGDSYHPCVNLCSTGDSVELVLPGIPLS